MGISQIVRDNNSEDLQLPGDPGTGDVYLLNEEPTLGRERNERFQNSPSAKH